MTRTACRPGSERLHIRSAVCGPDAVRGKCTHSVVQQLSTMPSWLYVNGLNPKALNPDPWEYWDDSRQWDDCECSSSLPNFCARSQR